jgi:NitT/TauT family transport system substrate-binding protein
VRTHTQDAIYRIAARQSIDPADVQAALRGVEMPQLAANHRYLGGPSPRLVSAAEPLARVMLRQGLLSQAANLQGLVSDSALPSAGGAV